MRVFAALLVLVLVSCAPKNMAKAAPAAPLPAIKWSDLAGAPFTLTSMTVKGKEIPLPATRRPTMQFDEKSRVSGLGGVNRYTTEGAVSGKEGISWTGSPISTKMAGPPEAMAVEDNFFQALQAVSLIELQGGKLKLASADGATRLELAR